MIRSYCSKYAGWFAMPFAFAMLLQMKTEIFLPINILCEKALFRLLRKGAFSSKRDNEMNAIKTPKI